MVAIILLIVAGLIYWQRAKIFSHADVTSSSMIQLDKTTYKPGENIAFNFINLTGSKIPFLYVAVFPANIAPSNASTVTSASLTANWKSQVWSAQIVNSYADGSGGLANGDHWGKTWDQKNTFTKVSVPEDSYTAVYFVSTTAGLSQVTSAYLKSFSISSATVGETISINGTKKGYSFSFNPSLYKQYGKLVFMLPTSGMTYACGGKGLTYALIGCIPIYTPKSFDTDKFNITGLSTATAKVTLATGDSYTGYTSNIAQDQSNVAFVLDPKSSATTSATLTGYLFGYGTITSTCLGFGCLSFRPTTSTGYFQLATVTIPYSATAAATNYLTGWNVLVMPQTSQSALTVTGTGLMSFDSDFTVPGASATITVPKTTAVRTFDQNGKSVSPTITGNQATYTGVVLANINAAAATTVQYKTSAGGSVIILDVDGNLNIPSSSPATSGSFSNITKVISASSYDNATTVCGKTNGISKAIEYPNPNNPNLPIYGCYGTTFTGFTNGFSATLKK